MNTYKKLSTSKSTTPKLPTCSFEQLQQAVCNHVMSHSMLSFNNSNNERDTLNGSFNNNNNKKKKNNNNNNKSQASGHQ